MPLFLSPPLQLFLQLSLLATLATLADAQRGGLFHVTVPDDSRSVAVTVVREPREPPARVVEEPEAEAAAPAPTDPATRRRLEQLRTAATRTAACEDLRQRWTRCFERGSSGRKGAKTALSQTPTTPASRLLSRRCKVHKTAYCLCCDCCFHFDVHSAHRLAPPPPAAAEKPVPQKRKLPQFEHPSAAKLRGIEAAARAASNRAAAQAKCDEYNEDQQRAEDVEDAQLFQVSEQCFYCYALAAHVQRVMGIMPVASWQLSKTGEVAQICAVTALAAPFVPNPFLPKKAKPIKPAAILSSVAGAAAGVLAGAPAPPNPALLAIKLMGKNPMNKITKCISIGSMLISDMAGMFSIAPLLTPNMGNAWMLVRSPKLCEDICVLKRAVEFIMRFLGLGAEKDRPPPPPPPPGCNVVKPVSAANTAHDSSGGPGGLSSSSKASQEAIRNYVRTMGESYVEQTIHRAFGHVHEEDRGDAETTIGLEMEEMVNAFHGPAITTEDLFLGTGHYCRQVKHCAQKSDAPWKGELREIKSGGAMHAVPGIPAVEIYVGRFFVHWTLDQDFAHLMPKIPRGHMVDAMAGPASHEDFFAAIGRTVREDQKAVLSIAYWRGAAMERSVTSEFPALDGLRERIGQRYVSDTVTRNFQPLIDTRRFTEERLIAAMAGSLQRKIFYRATGAACEQDKRVNLDTDSLWASFRYANRDGTVQPFGSLHRSSSSSSSSSQVRVPGVDGARYLVNPNRYANPLATPVAEADNGSGAGIGGGRARRGGRGSFNQK
jgi:hypothetical protein